MGIFTFCLQTKKSEFRKIAIVKQLAEDIGFPASLCAINAFVRRGDVSWYKLVCELLMRHLILFFFPFLS